jgi:hypothetical protein
MSFFDDAISTVGRGLAQTAAGALSDATGVDVGGIMNTLFGNGQTSGGEALSTVQQELQAKWTGDQASLTMLSDGITQQSAQLAELGNQIGAISTAIASLNAQLSNFAELLANLAQSSLYQQWQAVDVEMTEYIVAIDTSYQTYGQYAADPNIGTPNAIPTTEVSELMNDVLNMNNGPKVALNAISTFIMDDSQAKGVLQLWSSMVSPLVAGGQIDYRDAVKQYINYYRKLAYAQLRATNLLMEAYNFNGDPTSATDAWTDYKKTVLSQESTFMTWLIPLIYSGINPQSAMGGRLTVVPFTSSHAILQLDPGVQRLGSGPAGKGYIEPSAVLRSAEELLANLYITDPDERRIVLLMAYTGDAPIGPAVDQAALTLSPAGGGDPVAATRKTRLGAPYAWPGDWVTLSIPPSDDNMLFSTLYVTRFVYSAGGGTGLPDGDYEITNINGQNGLVPYETYISRNTSDPPPPFLNDAVLNYPLHVDGAKQFDFMNFMAYVIPISGPWQTS